MGRASFRVRPKFLAAVLGVLILAAGGVVLLQGLTTFVSEFDGTRPVAGGYTLSKLKNSPRVIIGPGGNGVCIPAPPFHDAPRQVGRYAELDLAIVGELEPYRSTYATSYFIIDLTRHTAAEFTTEAQWHAAMHAAGIDPKSVRLRS